MALPLPAHAHPSYDDKNSGHWPDPFMFGWNSRAGYAGRQLDLQYENVAEPASLGNFLIDYRLSGAIIEQMMVVCLRRLTIRE
jgi:hypothetical protein